MNQIIPILLFIFCHSISLFGQKELVIQRIDGLSSSDKISDIQVFGNDIIIASKEGVYSWTNDTPNPRKKIDYKNAVAISIHYGNTYAAFNDNSVYINNKKVYQIENSGVKINDLELYGNQIWLATNNGVYVINNDTYILKKRYTSKNSKLNSNNINFVHGDQASILWIGTERGVIRVSEDKWKSYDQSHNFLAITEFHDAVWLVSNKELYEVRSFDNRWGKAGLRKSIYQGVINDITIDNDGILYLASDVLIKFDPINNKLEKYSESLGLVSEKCISLACDANNNLYVGTSNSGLYKVFYGTVEVDELRVLTLLENPIKCPEGMDASLVLDISGGMPPYEYSWTPAYVNGTNPNNLKAGTYEVTVKDVFGNETTSSITVEDPFPLRYQIVEQSSVTEKRKRDGKIDIDIFGGTAPYEVNWEDGKKGTERDDLNFGFHYLTITDENGCKIEDQIQIGKPKILTELDINKIKVGEILQIQKLYFEADSTNFRIESEEVLDEIFEFMVQNPGVVVEIGGHTNNIPPDDYCNQISTARSKSVANYISQQGISENRIIYKGYGKRKPIASNNSIEGRKRNQRVEIKILGIK